MDYEYYTIYIENFISKAFIVGLLQIIFEKFSTVN